MTLQKNLLSCTDVTKEFQTDGTMVKALRGINFYLNADELVMLMGPSGSGKTTLLSVIATLLKQTSGSCQLLGQEVSKFTEAEASQFRRENIGFIFQSYLLVPALTALENAIIPLLLEGVPEQEAKARGIALFEKVGMKDKIDRLPRQLSGGEQQRVSIVRGLIHNPKILLCDEPTSALDHETGVLIMQLLKDLQRETGCGLIIVTHDTRILSFADRICHIEDGHLVNE